MHTPRARLALLVLAALVAAPLALGPAAAHENDLAHVNPVRLKLGPGETGARHLHFEEGPFSAGWVFVLNAAVDASPMRARLVTATDRVAAEWTIAPADRAVHVSALLPEDGQYHLVVENVGDQPATFLFWYDQSCNCAAKPIPPDLPGGLVVFNADVQEGSRWRATFQEPPVHAMRFWLVERVNETSRWPEDFRVLQESPAPERAGEQRVHAFEWTADKTQRYYFFAQSARADTSRFDTSAPENAVRSVMVVPEFEQLAAGEAAPNKTPAPGLALVVLAGLVALLCRRR